MLKVVIINLLTSIFQRKVVNDKPMNDAIDTHLNSVMTRIAAFNSSRKVYGPIDAQDWPPKQIPVQNEAFYLLVLAPMPSGTGESSSSPIYSITLQWQWYVVGTEITTGIRGRVRGDRGRTNRTMMEELLYGMFPYFATKMSTSINEGDGSIVLTKVTPQEQCSWTKPKFTSRVDRDSGVVYGIATVYLTDIQNQVLS